MAFQMVRSFFGQRSPSRSRIHEPIIESESFGNQGGKVHYDTRDVGKSANSNWFELAQHDKEASESGRKPHRSMKSCMRHFDTIGARVIQTDERPWLAITTLCIVLYCRRAIKSRLSVCVCQRCLFQAKAV